MPRIRKQTSNRGTTFQRSKIGKKAAETRKKNKRATKKDVTWKSNKKKDPGIPNSYPYKDQLLAEVAEQRRINEEEKLRIRAEKQALYAASKQQPNLNPNADGDEDDEDTLGVNVVSGLRVRTGKAKPVAATDDDDDEEMEGGMEVEDEDGEAAPLLFDADLPTLQAALEQADVLLEVVDARDPLGFRSPWLEELFVGEDEEGRKGKVVVVLTKIDLVPREALQQWLNYLRPRFMTILFKSRLPSNRVASGRTPKTIKNPPMHPLPPTAAEKKAEEDRRMKLAPEEVLGREELLEVLERWAGEKKADKKRSDEDFVVTVAGLPNVGKSSVLNTLLESTRFPIAAYPPTSTQSKPTTTTPSSSIYTSPSSSTTIKFVDTPGWIFADVFPGDDDEEDAEEKEEQEDETEEEAEMWEVIEQNRIKDLLRRNIGRVERIKEPLPLVEYIISLANANDLMLLYATPAFLTSDPHSFLTSVARSQGRLKKHAVPDLDAAARLVLRDWSLGLFPSYTTPPKGKSLEPRVPAELETLKTFAGEREEAVLARCRTRREMIGEKGGRGLVRMQVDRDFVEEGGDLREVVLDDELRMVDGEESDGSFDGEEDGDEEDEGWEDEDEEMEDVEGEEVFAGEDGEEPVDDLSSLEDDEAASDEEEDDPSLPSMLDLISAAPPPAAVLPSSRKRSAPKPTPAAARPSKKGKGIAAPNPAVVAAEKERKKVVFAAKPKGKTPKGYGTVDEENAPVPILKKTAPLAPAPAPVPASKKDKKKGKKAAAAAVPAPAPVTASPAVGEDAVELKKTKEAKKAKKAAAPAKAAAPVAEKKQGKTASKAAERAGKGEEAYSFDAHFF